MGFGDRRPAWLVVRNLLMFAAFTRANRLILSLRFSARLTRLHEVAYAYSLREQQRQTQHKSEKNAHAKFIGSKTTHIYQYRRSLKQSMQKPHVELGCALVVALLNSGCSKTEPRVVVYCAQDKEFAEVIFPQFQQQKGLTVAPHYDTEATKSVSLYQELARSVAAALRRLLEQ